jgi:DNA integrity scanning protein DisA with diadenylate cyclase activity
LAGKNSLDHLLTGGVPLGGKISQEIIEAIFRKVSPVHDGATVIEGSQISRVGVFLPLTRRTDIPTAIGN